MVNELLEGIHLIASVEAIALGAKVGIHPLILYDIISNAAGNSWFDATEILLILFSPPVAIMKCCRSLSSPKPSHHKAQPKCKENSL